MGSLPSRPQPPLLLRPSPESRRAGAVAAKIREYKCLRRGNNNGLLSAMNGKTWQITSMIMKRYILNNFTSNFVQWIDKESQ